MLKAKRCLGWMGWDQKGRKGSLPLELWKDEKSTREVPLKSFGCWLHPWWNAAWEGYVPPTHLSLWSGWRALLQTRASSGAWQQSQALAVADPRHPSFPRVRDGAAMLSMGATCTARSEHTLEQLLVCAINAVSFQSAVRCCCTKNQIMRRASKGKGHLPYCHSTSNSQLIFLTHKHRNSLCLSQSSVLHTRQQLGPVLAAGIYHVRRWPLKDQVTKHHAGHNFAICIAKN